MRALFEVLLVLGLAAFSIFLAAVEASFYLTKRRRLAHLARENARAELVNRYLDDPPLLLMPIHIGTYTAHVGMTVIVTSLFLDLAARGAMAVAFLVMVIYLLLFRLSLPYGLVRRNPERSLLLLLPAFHVYGRAMRPLVTALRKRAELEPADDEGSPAPELPPPPIHDPDEERLAEALARFEETLVKDVMTPRPDAVAIAAERSVGELRALMRESKYSRIPVYRGDLDDIVGVVEVRDVLDYDGDHGAPLEPLARPVHLVPETKKISELLRELQSQRTTFAVVINEYGGVAGLVSVEDIVEELVGEIKDEYDVESEPIQVEEGGAVLVAGRVALDRLEQALETSLEVEGVDVGTVGGFVTTVFGRIPRAGERMHWRELDLEVVDAERKRVNRVRVKRRPAEDVA
ncbi:MAG: hemolysin family protein [Vicinamibacteria bacterium]